MKSSKAIRAVDPTWDFVGPDEPLYPALFYRFGWVEQPDPSVTETAEEPTPETPDEEGQDE